MDEEEERAEDEERQKATMMKEKVGKKKKVLAEWIARVRIEILFVGIVDGNRGDF